MEWTNVQDRMPDYVRQTVAVYAPLGLYEDDCGLPSVHVIYWYKNGFSEETDRHNEIMVKVTHWYPIPDNPE